MPNRVDDGVLLSEVYVVLDIASQTKDVSANSTFKLAECQEKLSLLSTQKAMRYSSSALSYLGSNADNDMTATSVSLLAQKGCQVC